MKTAIVSLLAMSALMAKPNEGSAAGKPAAVAPLPPVAEPIPPVAPAPLPPVADGTVIPPVAPVAEAPAKAERVKPIFSPVMSGLPIPIKSASTNPVGAKSVYDFDALVNVGDSFGVMNKTAAQLASTVTGANKRFRVQAKNDDGTPKFTAATDIKDAAGVVTGQTKPEPVMIPGKTFKVFDVYTGTEPGPNGEDVYYPATTPDDQRAPCRVFRTN